MSREQITRLLSSIASQPVNAAVDERFSLVLQLVRSRIDEVSRNSH